MSTKKYNPYKWHFITAKQTPLWIERRFGHKANEMISKYHGSTIEETIQYAKGKYYEYRWVVTIGDHTHDNAMLRRKLSHQKIKKRKSKKQPILNKLLKLFSI